MRTLRLTVHDDDAGREAGNIVVALADDADELEADLEDVAERVVTGIRQVLNGEQLDA